MEALYIKEDHPKDLIKEKLFCAALLSWSTETDRLKNVQRVLNKYLEMRDVMFPDDKPKFPRSDHMAPFAMDLLSKKHPKGFVHFGS